MLPWCTTLRSPNLIVDMFYSRVGSHLSDVEAGMSSYPTVWDDKKPPVAGASPPDHPSYIKDLRNHSSDVRSNDLPLKETVTTRAPMPTVEHTHGPATQTQYHVDATSLYAFALGTFPTSILLLIVLRGVPPRNRDSRSPATSPAIPSTVVTYLDFLDRQQAPPSPQSTDGEYTTSLLSDSTPPSPLYDGEPPDSDIPSTPASPEMPEEPVHIARNPREAALDEWELAFVSLLLRLYCAANDPY